MLLHPRAAAGRQRRAVVVVGVGAMQTPCGNPHDDRQGSQVGSLMELEGGRLGILAEGEGCIMAGGLEARGCGGDVRVYYSEIRIGIRKTG